VLGSFQGHTNNVELWFYQKKRPANDNKETTKNIYFIKFISIAMKIKE
jgi:hypothetical protein